MDPGAAALAAGPADGGERPDPHGGEAAAPHSYATHSAVGIYDPERHFLDLDDLTPSLVGDALAAMVRHVQAVRHLDATARWSSINGNYLPPSGASLVHPHLQSAHDSCGLTGQRLLVEQAGAWKERHGSYWAALIEQEAGGPRWVGHIGRVAWLTPFAPTGFHEVWAVVSGAADVTDLTEDDSRALGQGLSQVLAAFKAWNLTSFNFGVIGGGPQAHEHGHQVVLKVLSRSNPEPGLRAGGPCAGGSDQPGPPGRAGRRRPRPRRAGSGRRRSGARRAARHSTRKCSGPRTRT